MLNQRRLCKDYKIYKNLGEMCIIRKKSAVYNIPTSMSSVLRPSQHIFPDYIRLYLETSIHDLNFSKAHTFEKPDFLDLNFFDN